MRDLERAVRKKAGPERCRFADMEETLTELLGTRVTITHKKGRGKIIIEFFSEDDLERLMDSFSAIRQ